MTKSKIDRLLQAGRPAVITLGIAYECAGLPPSATSVDVEIRDPDNQSVDSVASPPVSHNWRLADGGFGGTLLTQVSFTPTSAGNWQVATRFEPSVGFAQHVVAAAESRLDAGFRIVSWPGGTCDSVEVNSFDSIYCLNGAGLGGRSLRVSRYGVDLVTDGPRAIAIDDTVVWLVRGSTLERYVDDGIGFGRTHSVALALSDVTLAAQGASVRAFGTGPQQLLRVTPLPDGGAEVIGAGTPQLDSHWLVSWSGGILGLGYANAVLVKEDGGTRVFQAYSAPVANDPRTIWFFSASGVAGLTLTGDGAVVGRTAVLPEVDGGSAMLFPQFGFTPLVRTSPNDANSIVVPRVGTDSIVFEWFDSGPDYFPVSSARPDSALALSRDGKWIKVFRR